MSDSRIESQGFMVRLDDLRRREHPHLHRRLLGCLYKGLLQGYRNFSGRHDSPRAPQSCYAFLLGRKNEMKSSSIPFIEQAAWKDAFRLTVRFDNGVTKTINLRSDAAERNIQSLLDPEYFKRFTIASSRDSLLWPNGESYSAEMLYDLGIRCRMEMEEPAVEWYLSYFDEHLEGVEILFAKSCTLKSSVYQIPLFILFSQHGRLYRVDDEIIDWCDPTCGAGWERIRRETTGEELLDAIEHGGLGIVEEQDVFRSELRAFLEKIREP